MDDLLSDFLTETNESLAELDVALLRLERAPDDGPTLSLIFRLVHTIKGTCGFLGLPRLERVAHAGENVLVRVRDGVLTVTPELVSTVLSAIDRIKEIVAGLAAGGAEPAGDDAALIAALDAAADGRMAAPPVAQTAAVAPSAFQPPPRLPSPSRRPPSHPPPSHRPAPSRRPTRRSRRANRRHRSPDRRSASAWTCWKA